ncbi:S-acyl fatty acid synthase thioesterase, medium chain-like [Mantella aurantiaca]
MDKLINCLYSQPNATTRLICFPWAGGGSLYNTQWGRLFDDSVEVYSLRFPGRESRSREPFPHSLDQLLDDIIDVLLPFLREKRFAFFGHSFGSFNSYATAARLKEKYGLQPIHLFVSGVSAPRSPYSSSSQKKSELSDEDFLKWMAVKQGTPPELLHDEEAIQLFLPLMKTDLKLLENHV